MSQRIGINLLAAVMVAAQCDGAPVTYVILTLRLNGFGGDRACRGLIEEMKQEDLIHIDQCPTRVDRRTKVVRMTQAGWKAVAGHAHMLNGLIESKLGMEDKISSPRHNMTRQMIKLPVGSTLEFPE